MFPVDIVERCKRNDRNAQMALYRKYSNGMYGVALRFLRNGDDAEDVLQEAFIKAFRRIDQYRGEVAFGAWLKKIVVNQSLDFLKSKQLQMVGLEEGYMEVTDDGDWTVDDGITVEEVLLAIEKLPDKYGQVVQLFLVEGYDHEEISGILGISHTASRTRLLRGKGHLKELLKAKEHVTGS